MKKYLGPGSSISDYIENYEYRSEQITMAEAIRESIQEDTHLLIEAGCGIGKSFAYLIPFILWAAKKKNRKVAIATYTKTLQQQLLQKDIPLLQKAMNKKFKAAMCVGSNNYICLKRYNNFNRLKLLDGKQEAVTLNKISDWISETDSGLKLNTDFKISKNLWDEMSRSSELCDGKNCDYYESCFYFKARKKQIEADLLIINHHLLFHDVASDYNILPGYGAIVFDEAQNIEDVAGDTLGFKVSKFRVNYLLGKIFKGKNKRSFIRKAVKDIKTEDRRKIIQKVKKVKKTAGIFFNDIIEKFGNDKVSYRLQKPGMFNNTLSRPLMDLAAVLKKTAEDLEEKDIRWECNSYARRAREMAEELKIIINMELPNYVYFLKIRSKHSRIYCSFNGAPVEVSTLLREQLFEKRKPIILTSATLTVENSFDFIKNRLGIHDAKNIKLESPFDYKNKVLLYLPRDIPHPDVKHPKLFENSATDSISEILTLTGGRTFILFTSYRMLNGVGLELVNRFPDTEFLLHGELPRRQMLKKFRKNPKSVLLGTLTFWQGVDLPGKLLECVILTKLPFGVPNDPVTEARLENYKQKGKNPFMEYQVPRATLLFKQGFGRLIRHRNDSGIVAVLDTRVKTKRYGRMFLKSLPGYTEINSFVHLKNNYKNL
ncbi:MAG: ATP-dependent DNA helicase [Elusimicrobiota bacterium]